MIFYVDSSTISTQAPKNKHKTHLVDPKLNVFILSIAMRQRVTMNSGSRT